ncbi:hypothetical protein C8J48_0917 [Desmospora activa DSM 45169]|uniref:Uncharacterized protein n=2 Tax=Desmospora TaxID=500614 RepID=A0A2T4Z8X0_9BACL|nr:hypothetical protein C8J48_0917 [Desmospora activa DSM 45169]
MCGREFHKGKRLPEGLAASMESSVSSLTTSCVCICRQCTQSLTPRGTCATERREKGVFSQDFKGVTPDAMKKIFEDFKVEDAENLEEPELRIALVGVGAWIILVGVYAVLMKMEWISGL